jgi:hypothetical protein
LKGAKEKNRVIKHNPVNLIGTSRQLNETPIDYTFKQELQNSKSRRIQAIGLDPGDWIKGLELGKNFKISRPRESRRLDWIQLTGLVNSNKAKTSVYEDPVD